MGLRDLNRQGCAGSGDMGFWVQVQRLEIALERLPVGAAFSGLTAAWLHGLDVEPCDPIEATIPYNSGVSQRAGIAVRHATLVHDETIRMRGFPATSIPVTLLDVCRRLSLVEAVVVADAALHAGLTTPADLARWVRLNPKRHGIRRLRRVVEHAEPAAASPMESRLRMALVISGLPRPKAQVPIYDVSDRFVGRPDLYYELAMLGIEYDGGAHRDQLAEDNRRQNNLLSAGVRLLRFTAHDVLGQPAFVVTQVASLLGISGKTLRIGRLRREFSGKTLIRPGTPPRPSP